MARDFREVASTRTDMSKYGPNYEAVFGRPEKKEDDGQRRIECPSCGRAFYSSIPGHLTKIGCAFCGEFIEVGG